MTFWSRDRLWNSNRKSLALVRARNNQIRSHPPRTPKRCRSQQLLRDGCYTSPKDILPATPHRWHSCL